MAEGIAFSIVGKLAEYTVDPVLRQVKYLFFYDSNIENLLNKIQELENRRNDVKLQVDAAKRNVEIIGKEVSTWLQDVDLLIKEIEYEVQNGVASSEMRCLFNRCPNLKSRYLLSRRATKMTIEADKLKVVGTFERAGYSDERFFKTRLSIKKKIKEALKDKDIGIIGICGMPGVGKTTMAKEIVNEVKDEKLFEEVAFAVVSIDPDINKIQDQLVEMLGLKINEKTTSMRARLLRRRLEGNNGKSILVILDDVWNEIDLGSIGIPSLHDCKGLKIMFTTRLEDTCSKMDARRKFKIEVLDENEGWQFFKDTAGISDDETDDELVSIAKEVANECGDLPLALGVVGKALKGNKAVYAWRDALQQLQRSSTTNLEGMDNKLYQSIRLGYDYLASNEERELLLLCSLFAKDESIPIEYLVSYARGLELFKGIETLDETRDRAKNIMDNLKSCNLLQPGGKEDEVKLHNVIRDFCLQMPTTKDKYLVNHAGLTEWSEHDADESCCAISITFDKLDQLPGGLKYRNVKLLRVVCRELGECNISEDFFKDMKELRVLELKGMCIQIPSSIQSLTGLRTLCLTECKIHSQLSMIGGLKNLEILSFHHSFIGDYSPIEFTNLCNLRSLDLRFHELSYPHLLGVLSGMKKLEELYLGRYIPIEGDDQRCIIEGLCSLTSLRTFQISTDDTQILVQILPELCLKNLKRFHIDEVKVFKNLASELDGDGFFKLRTPTLSRSDFEYLIDVANSMPCDTFGKLEPLELKGLPNLTEMCNGNLPSGVFKPPLFFNLMIVKMYDCDAIRSLFRESVAKCLVNLQSLDLYKCVMLEEVVSTDAQENEVTITCKMLEFPKLKKINFENLRRFKSFTSQANSSDDSQTLFNQVHFPNMKELNVDHLDCIVKLLGKEMLITSLNKLRDMVVSDCAKLQSIAESDSIQLLQNLELLNVVRCNALKVLFEFKGIKVTNDDAEIIMLGRLTRLWIFSLPELVNITRMVPKGIRVFQNLKKLVVLNCESLSYLFSPSMAKSLAALYFLQVSDCKSIKEIVGKEEEEEGTSEIKIVEGMETIIVFPKLCSLLLVNLPSIQSFCSQNYEPVFPSMTTSIVRCCPKMDVAGN